MKVANFVLKAAAAALALAAAVCCVVAFWDKLGEACGCLGGRIRGSRCCGNSEYDDYVDWDED